MVVKLEHVFKDYIQGKFTVPVLKDISMEVDEGEYLAIMGPSGSGKTTLMNILGCLDVATKGSYYLEEQDISQLDDRRMAEIRNRYIGFVFQTFHLLPRQSAVENVELPLLYGGYSKKERRAMAQAALERVGLGDRMDFKPSQLSGGQCQRVAIARALINEPSILLADEPTGNLDNNNAWEIMKLLEEINSKGTTVIVVTHNLEIVKVMKKRVITVKKGTIVSDSKEGGYDDEN